MNIIQQFKKNFYFSAVVLILFFAVILRFYKLGDVPHGLTWDEAAIGYNGFAVMTTRRDEWLAKMPVSFRSFGDYKAPLAIYINGFFTFLFGLTPLAVRLPFALSGVAGVLGFILLTRELLRLFFKQEDADKLALVAGILLTFSPWHIHFSRIGFESGICLTLLIWGIYFYLKFLFADFSQTTKKRWVQGYAFLSVLLLVASLYTYHSAKITTPLLILFITAFFFRQAWQKKKWLLVEGVAAAVLLLPLIKDSVFASGSERLSQASVFTLGLSPIELLTTLGNHFLIHFTPGFLILGQTTTLRHGDGHWGVLFPTTFFLLLCGVVFSLLPFFSQKFRAASEMKKPAQAVGFAVVWVVLGILPAAIGRDVPHANRAFLALPGLLILAVLGSYFLILFLHRTALNAKVSGSKGEKDLLVKSVVGVLIALHAFFILSYLHSYYTDFAQKSANDFQDGYLGAMQYVMKYEDQADKIMITNEYGQPYIYALFARKTSPILYHGGSLIKYEFPDHVTVGDLGRPQAIIVASPQEIDPRVGTKLIYGSDGNVRFVIVNTIK